MFVFSIMPFTKVVRGGEGEFGDTHSKAHGVGNIKNGYTSIWVPLTTGKNKILLLRPKVIFATAEATKLLNSELIKLFFCALERFSNTVNLRQRKGRGRYKNYLITVC